MKKLLLLFLIAIAAYGYGQHSKQTLSAISTESSLLKEDMVINNPISVLNNSIQNDAPMAEPTNWALPQNGGTSQNNRAPSNYFKYQRTEYLITPAEMASSGFLNGDIFNGIGFLVQQAGINTFSGTLNIYLRNTTDATYTLGSTWTIASFTQVYANASYTIPINNNAYFIVPFSSGYTYTGGGIYVAWEFSTTSAVASGSVPVTHFCSTALTSGLRGANSASALPTALGTSSFRPATLFTTSSSLTDVTTITNIYATEKVATPFGTPVTVGVRVSNVSAAPATFDVTVNGSDGYTETQTVTALAAGTSTVVNFTGWTPVTAGNYSFNAITSVVAGETFTLNNSLSISTNINTNLMSYIYSTTSPPSGYGFTYPGLGIFASKQYMSGVGQVNGANLVISAITSPTAAGNVISAVLLNSAGTIVATSPTYTILAADLGTTKSFTFTAPVVFNNEYYYVGMLTTAGTAQHYPLALFYDIPYRGGINYTFGTTGGTPSAVTANYRFGIEAQVGAYAGAVNPGSFTATAISTSQINLAWTANPTNDNVLVAYSLDGVFGTPVNGSVYSAGQTIAGGGTVLQYNTSTSFAHTGLGVGTKYYYKIWAYNGTAYSLGVAGNATTFCNLTAAPITEDFELAAFAPSCWTLSNTVTAWNRSTAASGYGVGTASAEANFYNISSTVPFDLITLPFDASSLSNPAVRFDYAYAAYSAAEIDQVEILYSTDNGLNYTTLATMLGGPDGELNTAGLPTTSSFVPTSAQWSTKTISLPTGTNKVKFRATSAYGNNLYIDNVKILQYLAHDVAALNIDESFIQAEGTISPKVTVANYGGSAESFSVTLSTYGYSSTKSVVALAPSATVQVTFDPWNKVLGDYSLLACTSLGTDQNNANNCVTKSIKVLDLNKTVYGYNAYPNDGTDPEGPASFSLNDPGVLNSLADQSSLQFINGGTWANDTWYGVVYNTVAPFDFITIDKNTGARTVLGDLGVSLNGLSYNPVSGIMYGVGYSSATTKSNLYTINMANGATTMVGSTAANILLINLAIDAAGNCYAVDITGDNLGTLDLATGAFTVVGPIGFNANYAQDMEFDRDRGELYLAAQDLTSGWLSWVNKTTGTTSKIGDFEGGAEITGFAIPYSSNKALTVKAFLEGLYNGSDLNQAYDENGPHWAAGIADKVTLELRNSGDGSLVYSLSNVDLGTNGIITATIPAAYNGSYYIYISHRNHLTTSTASAVSFSGSTISYDFTTGVSQAYASNMKDMAGTSVIFGGDVNQDMGIDASDMIDVDNDNAAFGVGYIPTDVDGSGGIDATDMIIVDNNNAAFVGAILPF